VTDKIRALSTEEHHRLAQKLLALRKAVKAVPLNLIANNPNPRCLTYFSLADREVDALLYRLADIYFASGGGLPSPYHGAQRSDLKTSPIKADMAEDLVYFLRELADQGRELLNQLYMRVPGHIYDLAGCLSNDLVLTVGSYRGGLRMPR